MRRSMRASIHLLCARNPITVLRVALTIVGLILCASGASAGIFRAEYTRLGLDGGVIGVDNYEFTDFVSVDTLFEPFALAESFEVAPPAYLPPYEPNATEAAAWVLYE